MTSQVSFLTATCVTEMPITYNDFPKTLQTCHFPILYEPSAISPKNCCGIITLPQLLPTWVLVHVEDPIHFVLQDTQATGGLVLPNLQWLSINKVLICYQYMTDYTFLSPFHLHTFRRHQPLLMVRIMTSACRLGSKKAVYKIQKAWRDERRRNSRIKIMNEMVKARLRWLFQKLH